MYAARRLEGLLVTAYRGLPRANHLDSIAGIGAVTAAVLTAFAVTSAAVRSAGVRHTPAQPSSASKLVQRLLNCRCPPLKKLCGLLTELRPPRTIPLHIRVNVFI